MSNAATQGASGKPAAALPARLIAFHRAINRAIAEARDRQGLLGAVVLAIRDDLGCPRVCIRPSPSAAEADAASRCICAGAAICHPAAPPSVAPIHAASCPFAAGVPAEALAIDLVHNSRGFGALTVVPPADLCEEAEFRELLHHIASDLAHALRALDVAGEQARQAELLHIRQRAQELLTSISAELLRGARENSNADIDHALGRLGRFAGSDRAYIFLLRDHGRIMDNTHEWCAAGIEPQRDTLQNVPSSLVPWWMEKLNRREAIFIHKLDDLPPAAAGERAILEPQGIQSLLVLPMADAGELVGFVGLDWVRCSTSLQTELIPLLQLGANILRGALLRMQAMRQLRESEARLRTLVQSAPTGILITTCERIVFANETANRILGCASEGGLVGSSIIHRVPEETREALRHVLLEVIAGVVPAAGPAEQSLLRADGGAFDAEYSIVPIRHQNEAAALLFFQNITSRKRLELDLRQAQKMEAVGRLAGGVAHDFNNMLAAMLMNIGVLQVTPGLGSNTYKSLKDLESDARRATSLVRQLIMFSARSVMKMESVALNRLVTDTLEMITRLIGADIRVEFLGTGELPRVKADVSMMEQVLVNLVLNARDAITGSGSITIRTSLINVAENGTARRDGPRPGRFVVLEVTDTGRGMDEETLKHVFEPFFTTKEVGRGGGLGLAAVHGIVTQHLGWIEAATKPGTGSTFRVMIPALPEVVVSDAPPPAAAARNSPDHKATILLVDDDPRVRPMLRRALNTLGFRVLEASSAQDALSAWKIYRDQIDLLFTDMIMPGGMNGLELAARVRSERPGLRVLLSSGHSAELVQNGDPAAARMTFLPKPYDMATLATMVRRALAEDATA